jgi:nicotinamide riboside kinase
MSDKALLVEFLGGAGCGKSTVSSFLYASLKMAGVECEFVPEYAKRITWEKRYHILEQQMYISGKQNKMYKEVEDDVDVIITDTSLLLGLMYAVPPYDLLHDVIISLHNSYDYMCVCLERTTKYNPKGRNETEHEAKIIDNKIEQLLIDEDVNYQKIDGSIQGAIKLGNQILKRLDINKELQGNIRVI